MLITIVLIVIVMVTVMSIEIVMINRKSRNMSRKWGRK